MKFSLSTKGSNDIIDITSKVSQEVKNSKVKDGICLISCPGSTCGITTLEYEPNLVADFKEFLEKLVPSNTRAITKGGDEATASSNTRAKRRVKMKANPKGQTSSTRVYRHDQTWGEANAPSHIRSALIKPFLFVPVENGKLVLGQWQSVVLIDFDNRGREREIIVKVISS